MFECKDHDGIAVVTLAHGKANAFDLEFLDALADEIHRLRQEATALVITGRGSIFSAGVDLLRVLEDGPDYISRFLPALDRFCETLFGFPKPVVAAINGHAIAGGCVCACMADARFVADGPGTMGVPELLVGVPFPAVPLEIVRSVVPARYLREVLYHGVTFSPAAAVERGLADEVVSADQLLERALHEATSLASLEPNGFRLTKAHVRRPYLDRMRRGAAESSADVVAAWCSEATRSRISVYVEKTFKRARSGA